MPNPRLDRAIAGLAALAVAYAASAVAQSGPSTNVPPPDAARPPMELRLGQAVLLALANNRALSVQRLDTEIRRTFEAEERAVFDPLLSADLSVARNHRGAATGDVARTLGGSLELSEALPTGTRLDAAIASTRQSGAGTDAAYTARATIGVTQALLQGRPLAVNLASLRLARMDTAISEYELRGFAEALVADVESAYWECALAQRRLRIVETSLAFAEQQLTDVEHRIRVGALPETELAAAQAETALRREALIDARSGVAASRLRLLRLADPGALAGPRRDLVLTTEPAVPELRMEPVDVHVAVAMRLRPDLNQARLKLRQGDIELVRTRNGLLPRMDLFVLLGDTGYAGSFSGSAGEIDGQEIDVTAGVTFEFPPANRQARSRHQRAQLTREQSAEAVSNLGDLVRVDVEAAYLEVDRTREQVAATSTTRRFQEEKVRSETAKFNVGRSTALLVAQAQRDLVASQVSEVDAVVRHLESLVALFRSDGSLLERRGLAAPGRTPAPWPADAPAPRAAR